MAEPVVVDDASGSVRRQPKRTPIHSPLPFFMTHGALEWILWGHGALRSICTIICGIAGFLAVGSAGLWEKGQAPRG
jgi:hypothetical protein